MESNINELVRENIQNLKPYSSARDEYTSDEGIFLDANENPFGNYNRYPDPFQLELKNRIAVIKNVNVENIFLGNGSDEIIDLTLRIFCKPGRDKALIFTPTYGMYEVCANINDVEIIKVPLTQDFKIEISDLNKCITDPLLKVIFICSPNNPTGNLLNVIDIEYILNNFNGIVVIDEAYIDFCDQESFARKINLFPKLIIIQTLSKAWGLAGIRLGIGIMNTEIIKYFNKVRPPYNISSANQKIALKKLENEIDFSKNIKKILTEKKNLISEIKKLSIVKEVFPSDTNFILVEVQNADVLYAELLSRKIIIRNRNSVIPNTVRITIGTAEENQSLINALKEISNV